MFNTFLIVFHMYIIICILTILLYLHFHSKIFVFIDNYEVCGLHTNIFNNAGIEVAFSDDCRTLDRRSGLTFFKYLHPANFSQPDLVGFVFF